MTLALLFSLNLQAIPAITLPAIVTYDCHAELLRFGGDTPDGLLVASLGPAWRAVVERLAKDFGAAYSIGHREWEELIAGAYHAAGFDEVVLTPRSGDFGRDVIATKTGVCSVRIFDQVKAYAPTHVVPADDVRALLGTITGAQNVSKGVLTTTSRFAPGVRSDPFLAPLVPHRLELRDRDSLLPWLKELCKAS